MKQIIFLLLVAMALSIPSSSLISQTGFSERFSYIAVNLDGTGLIRIIDPANPSQAIDWVSLPVNTGEFVGGGYLSPTGEWVLLSLSSNNGRLLRLFNLTNGNSREVVQNIQMTYDPPTLNSSSQSFAWSPNERYFAISYYVPQTDSQGIYIYDLILDTLSNFAPPSLTTYTRLAWSSDSTRLATASTMCNDETWECSRTAIDIFDAATATLNQTIDLSSFSAGPGGQNTNFCELRWSQDDSYIAFADHCDGSGLGGPREIQIIDLSSGSITQATSLTPTNVLPAYSLFTATYRTIWIDHQTLLISSEKQEGELSADLSSATVGPLTPQTFKYDVSTHQLQQVNDRYLDHWALSSTGLLGYVAYNYPANPTRGTLPDSATVEIASFDGQTLNTIMSASQGCDLSWNIDGTILAYIEKDIYSIGKCDPSTDTIVFVNVSTGITQSHTAGSNIIPLGWVDISNVNPTACSTTIPPADTTALISATASANNAGTPQILCLTSSTYTLDIAPGITGDITIVGNGATIVFEAGSGFEVAGDGALRLEHVTVIRSDDGGG